MMQGESRVRVAAIVAMDDQRVIGARGTIPWHLPEDLRRFSQLTRGHTVLMGRKTYESLPARFKPLPERKNVVVSTRGSALRLPEEVEVVASPDRFIAQCRAEPRTLPSAVLWVIGGEQIYRATQPFWDEVYLTMVPGVHEGDAFFPNFEEDFQEISRERGEACEYVQYARQKVPPK